MKFQLSFGGREGVRTESRQVNELGSYRLRALLCTSSSRYLNLGCLSDPAALTAEFWSSRSGWVEGQDLAPALGG